MDNAMGLGLQNERYWAFPPVSLLRQARPLLNSGALHLPSPEPEFEKNGTGKSDE